MMFSQLWITLSIMLFLAIVPLLYKKSRTKEAIRRLIIVSIIILAIIIAVLVFQVNFYAALLFAFIAFILADKKTYTKKRLIIYGVIIVFIGSAGYYIFRDNPDYVINHLKKHPESTSLYLRENGEELITYQSDEVRPLASTVKY